MANGRGRWLAVVASLAVAAWMIHAQNTERACCAETSATTVPVASPTQDRPAEAQLLGAPVSQPDLQFALPAGTAPESGLQVKTIWVARAISVMFPEITTIGGYRQDPLPWHPNGLAIDVMIPDFHTEAGIELGNQIVGLALANAERWGVLHAIWRQGYYPGIGAPSWTADYGNETANHFDHVHIATDGGGYPTGSEVYYLGSMR